MDGQVTWSDLGILFGKMSRAPSAATGDGTSTPCWKKLRVSQNQDFLYLDCRTSGNGQKQEPLTVMGGLSLGELTTLNAGEKPSETAVQEMLSVWGPHSVAEESRLSQILEVNTPPKYNLTAKACLGILRRAERRGKDMPARLKAVLLMQSASGGCDGRGKGALVQTEKSGTLGTGNDQTIFAAIPINDKATRWQGGGESRNHDGSGNGLGIGKEGDPSPTLTAGDRHGVMCGNQVPLTYQMNGFGDYRAAEVSSSCKQRDFKDSTDLVCSVTPDAARAVLYQPKSAMEENWAESETKNALRAGESKVSHAVMCSSVDCRNFREGGEVNGTLQAKESGGQSLNLNNTVRQNMVVRRLTPMECERLQGFPDHWTDIGEWTDEKGKKHKDADSPRYKALGNSIALPFWDWMLRRMARYLPEGATLGSLFDGISGFNVCWARIYGAECCRWSSEIEQFPIAVTKKHFGDEEAGKEGDFEKFFGSTRR